MYPNKDLTGVQGWLLLFIIQRLYAPFALLPTFSNQLTSASLATDRAHLIFLINVLSSTLAALTGILATIGIFRRSQWALNVVAMNLLLVVASGTIGLLQRGSFNSNNLPRAIVVTLVCIAWLVYFKNSERVRNTLGHNLFDSPMSQPNTISLP
jgi:hypothetical protein